MSRTGRPAIVTELAREMVARRIGVSCDEMAAAGCHRPSVKQALWRMHARGETFKGGNPRSPRFFASESDALAYVDPAPVKVGRQRLTRAKPAAEKKRPGPKKGTKKPPKALVVRAARQPLPLLARREQFEPIITSATKVTIAPPFVDRRWAPDVVQRVVNSDECSAWARAATEWRA